MYRPLVLVACLLASGRATLQDFSTSSSFRLETTGNGYHGLVSEDALLVNVTPPIRATGELVCGFSITNRHRGETPFEIYVKSQEEGTGELKAKRALNCEKKRSYAFDIQAVSCSGTYSDSVGVHVQVQDVNEFAPVWIHPSADITVEEGQIIDEIIRLEASDHDCSEKFGDICRYDIQTKNQPFEISKEGVVRNVRALSFADSPKYQLSIVASDCGGRVSAPLQLNIEVKKACNNGWTGVPSYADYIPGTGPQSIFGQSSFSVCPEKNGCEAKSFETTIHLETSHIGKGCDRDTYNLASQRQLCGANNAAVDLLPDPALRAEWAEKFVRDIGQEGDRSMVLLDGETGVDVPEDVLGADTPGQRFTLSTWMRHRPREDLDKHRKEHIICKADDHRKNRHHFAVFVRNCKLVLLLRREYQEGQENIFRPAEWRWKMPHVCDDEWHHYAISVDFPQVSLFVDGEKWIEERDDPEIIDDWPLHPAGDINTKITIGACWQGSEGQYKHQLRGYLAGLSLLPGSTEHSEVLKCLHQCAESLQVPATSQIRPGMEMVTDTQQSRVIVDGDNAENMVALVRQVAYLNTREFPAPGRRTATLNTKITCVDGSSISLAEHRIDVNVIPVPEPTIGISGTADISREYEDFKLGVRIFADVHIVMTTGTANGGEPVNGIENRLDHCSVTVSPPLNPDHEQLDVPEDLLRSLSILGHVSSDGAEFSGAEMIYNYERLLRQVTYTNKKPAYYLNRQFKITCSEMNRRFISNEYVQTLTVIHPPLPELVKEVEDAKKHSGVRYEQIPDHPDAHLKESRGHGVEQVGHKMFSATERESYLHTLAGQSHSNILAVIVVVCIAFLAVLLVLGIFRLRAAHHRAQREELQAETEMAWDDSALTITVNPMEETAPGPSTGGHCRTLVAGAPADDDAFETSSDEDEDESYRDEEDESSEDEEITGGQGGSRRLEWDHNI